MSVLESFRGFEVKYDDKDKGVKAQGRGLQFRGQGLANWS